MAAVDRIRIHAERYIWAIQRAGLTVDDYIERHPKVTLESWLDGTKEPTIRQLEDFAKSVNVPFGFLFLETVPEETIPFLFFVERQGNTTILI